MKRECPNALLAHRPSERHDLQHWDIQLQLIESAERLDPENHGCVHRKRRRLEGARHRGAHWCELQPHLASRRPGGRRASSLTNVVLSLSRKSHLHEHRDDGVSKRAIGSEEDDDVRATHLLVSCLAVLNTASRASRATVTNGSVRGPWRDTGVAPK
ncbi:hypothetical protein MTO96_005099 [Rhipicephalus appendiculatus]